MKIFNAKNVVGMILGLIVILVGIIFFSDKNIFYLLIVLGIIVAVSPFVIGIIASSLKEREIDERFLEFVRDLVENVKSGTPISKSISNLKKRDYGKLSPHIEKLNNQISLGIPLTAAFATMANDTRSRTISRAITLISQAEKAGGQIETILESVANSVNQTENLRNERKSSVFNLIVQGYIIFIVFIVIMLVLQYKILPLASDLGSLDVANKVGSKVNPEDMANPMLFMLLVQSFFTGLVIGKISEGDFKYGIKHSFILLTLALLITAGTRAILG
jgi:flagellar protein FlaJ